MSRIDISHLIIPRTAPHPSYHTIRTCTSSSLLPFFFRATRATSYYIVCSVSTTPINQNKRGGWW
jgi:hypothetical protein